MSLHPKAAHWFDIYTPRDQTVYALEALAATGQVELDRDLISAPMLDTRELRATLGAIERLTGRYAGLLPASQATHLTVAENPESVGQRALTRLRAWLGRQLMLQRRLLARKRELRNLELLRECLAVMGPAGSNLAYFSRRSRFLEKSIWACPRGLTETHLESAGLDEVYPGPRHLFHVLVRLSEDAEAPIGAVQQCEQVKVPAWLADDWSNREDRLGERIVWLVDQSVRAEEELALNRADPRLIEALDDSTVLRWYLDHTVTLTEDRRHCHITGWTTVDSPEVLQQALRRAHIDAVSLFRSYPPGQPPAVLPGRRGWARPFGVFVNMFGTPGSTELDPTPLLGIIVPLLFGLMFPDVGHGLMLAGLSLVLSRRYPTLRFLVPCGLAAAGFGLVFGETFGMHGPIPPLWVHPLDEPKSVLLAPLGLGIGIILLGLGLSGVESRWRGEMRAWLWSEGAVLLLYASALSGFFFRPLWAISALAFVLYVVGLLVTCERRWGHCLLSGTGRLLVSTFELASNTISFLRVGAFALAHAALSQTLLGLADHVETPGLKLLTLGVGHVSIVLVEGLMVFIQTTRLVLFEFFIRFLRADGRLFRPLTSPAKKS